MMYLGDQAVGINNEKTAFPLKKITSIRSLFYQATFDTEEVILDFDGAILQESNSVVSAFQVASNIAPLYTLIIRNLTISNVSCESAFRTNSIKKIIFDNTIFAPNSMQMMWYYAKNLESVEGEIDGSYCLNYHNTFVQTINLKNITFKPNTIKNNLSLYDSQLLTNTSLISIANGLDSTVTEKTVTLHPTIQNTCSTLMGSNNNGIFVADENSNLSLNTFITNIKGWQIV